MASKGLELNQAEVQAALKWIVSETARMDDIATSHPVDVRKQSPRKRIAVDIGSIVAASARSHTARARISLRYAEKAKPLGTIGRASRTSARSEAGVFVNLIMNAVEAMSSVNEQGAAV